MAIVLPHGVLFRGGEEGTIRKILVEKHNIETIIGLPANLFYGTGIPTIIMILRKTRAADDILFIDASKEYAKEGNKNKLRQRDIRKIVDTVINRKPIPQYSRLVQYDEIKNNEFNLNIPRYVDSSEKEDTHDICALMFGGIPNYEIDSKKLSEYWKAFTTLKKELFIANDSSYSTIADSNIKELIEKNNDVISFTKLHAKRFLYLKDYLDKELLGNSDNLHLSSLEMKIAETFKEVINDNDLIDYYDCFDVLDNAWQDILPDLEILKEQGYQAAREIDEIIVLKKNSKTKKLEEKVIGNDGRLIPFSMIQNIYFSDLAKKVNALENDISELSSEKEELLNTIDPEDKTELLKDDDSGEIKADLLKKKIAEIKKKIAKGAEYEDGSYESILMEIDSVNKKLTKIKGALKTSKKTLNDDTESKIKSLEDAEIHDLLTKKWIDPICNGITMLSAAVISKLEQSIIELEKKYETTFTELDSQIDASENALSTFISSLTGDKNDMKGLAQFKLLLGGNKNE